MDDENVSHAPIEHVIESAKSVERKPQVAREIDNLASAITVLDNLVESLDTRLSAVSNSVPRGDQPARPTDPMVPVAAGVHNQTDRILNVNIRIEEILQSLEV